MNDKHAVEVYDFEKKQLIEEKIPAEELLRFMYHNETFSALSLRYALSKNSFVSSIVGYWMSLPLSRKSVDSFIKNHGIKKEDFEKTTFKSFNDFFTRKLAKNSRPISKDSVIIPCDGRHLFYQDLSATNSFYVKGQSLSLAKLIKDDNLASLYSKGSMIISRLAPADYHRFHFPDDVTLSSVTLINGALYSVNPLALRKMIKNLTENKRLIVQMISKTHGNILQIIIGATNVGSIHLTAEIGKEYKKGDELGYFSFGGSMIITLFQAKSVEINNQFTLHTQNLTEVLLKMGTSLSSCE